MTPEQLQQAYRAVHVRRLAIEAEDAALEDLDLALDAYGRAKGWDLASIVDPVIEQRSPVAAGAGAEGDGETAVVPSAPIEQAGPPGGASAGSGPHEPAPTVPPDNAGVVQAATTPVHQAGGAGSTPAPRSSTFVHCPDCGESFKASGLGVHRRHAHGYKAGDIGDSRGPINCPDCGEAIAQKKNLARHRRADHGGDPRRLADVQAYRQLQGGR